MFVVRWGKLPTPLARVAYTFEVVSWEGWDHRRHGGVPPTPQSAYGVKLLLTNPQSPGDTHQFWQYTLTEFQDWSEWWTYLVGTMADHGMELSDDQPTDYDDPDSGGGGGYLYPPLDDDGEPEMKPSPPRKLTARFRRVVTRVARWFAK